MMRTLSLAITAAIGLLGCTTANPEEGGRPPNDGVDRPVREAIAAAYEVFEEAFYKGDAETIAETYTEDAEWLIPEAPIIKGREAISQAWKQLVGSGGHKLRIDVAEVQESGDWAYEIGKFTASTPEGEVLNSGKYIVIWKRQADGEWKTHRDIFNWDIPPHVPASNP